MSFQEPYQDTVGKLNEIRVIAENIRLKHMGDIYMFLAEGHSEHDCVKINSKVAEAIKKELGLDAELVSVSPLLNYEVKHFAVLVHIGGQRIIVDAVPELTGNKDEPMTNEYNRI